MSFVSVGAGSAVHAHGGRVRRSERICARGRCGGGGGGGDDHGEAVAEQHGGRRHVDEHRDCDRKRADVPVVGHTVAFSSSDSGIKFSPTTLNLDGTYTATLTSSTTAGTATITATDTSVQPPVSGQATLTQTPGPATNMALSLAPQSVIADGSSYTTATATVADAHGNPVPTDTVVFSSSDPGEKVLQVADNGNGTYSALIRSSGTPGPVTLTATDTSANLSVQSQLTQTANGSALSLVAFPAAAVTNEGVTLFAVVSSKAGSPSGTITFANGGAPIASCVAEPITPSRLTAICQTSFAASTSPEQLTAVFTPNAASNVASSVERR